jgi:predicted signal transduction protein with EAL and GGDEF domain
MPTQDPEISLEKRVAFLEHENALLKQQKQKLEAAILDHERRHVDLENRLSIDAKTGLPNHHRLSRDLHDELEAMHAAGSREKIPLALAIFKLDGRYGLLTKTMKPSVSEWVIYQTGQRLLESLDSGDALYNTREDEFAVVMRSPTSVSQAVKRAERAIEAITKPHVFSGYHVSVGAKAGIALFPEHGLDKGHLLYSADIALENAKAETAPVRVFEESMRESAIERMDLQNAIIKALETQAMEEISKQFKVFLQPIVTFSLDGEGGATVERVDAEALLRWSHPTRGMLPPDSFIPVAEETGLILPIGNWLLYRCADMLGRWARDGESSSSLAMNISAKQFVNDAFMEIALKLVKERDYLRDTLRLEITESCLMDDPAQAIGRMRALSEEKIEFSVDDFGTGYSSLSYLSKLPVRSLKIDRSFVRDMTTSKHDNAIVKTVISLGREMGFDVICEGVETFEQLSAIHEHGCRSAQGYLFGRPMPEEEFSELRKRLSRRRVPRAELARIALESSIGG